jgi:Tyrosine phosphatase family
VLTALTSIRSIVTLQRAAADNALQLVSRYTHHLKLPYNANSDYSTPLTTASYCTVLHNRAMKLIADPANHPVAFYCTAGKDRTGIIAALILSAIDTPLDSILDDYTISDDAYKQLGDKDAMVGALRQQDLDSDTFLCAPRSIMADTLALVQSKYGGTGAYLDSVGFDAQWRAKLKAALTAADPVLQQQQLKKQQ